MQSYGYLTKILVHLLRHNLDNFFSECALYLGHKSYHFKMKALRSLCLYVYVCLRVFVLDEAYFYHWMILLICNIKLA